ncbi:MAG: lipid-A-disaccharide synthase [Bdellovibrionales bacterium RIFOXYD1_FULL_53_11]|nr:MAG: lipid-A-disaccharide synthase [Bdellovibrionales bacterium RIFOXYD1_FULL_53_11]
MKILLSAAEASSDIHGAALLGALKKLKPDIDAFGVGGPALAVAGLRAVVDARELLAIGFSEIITKLPRIFRALDEIENAARTEKPDIAVVIDYPDFHFRLAKRLGRLGIPVVYFIPPKVWIWRSGRVGMLKRYFKKLLCILPFEEDFYRVQDVDAVYVGNPLVQALPLDMTRADARRRLSLRDDDVVVALLTGSRMSEYRGHIRLFARAARAAAAKAGGAKKLIALMPFPATADLKTQVMAGLMENAVRDAGPDVELRVSQGNSAECLVAADAALVKSGTATLEAGVLGCPHAVVYNATCITQLIFKYFIRWKGPVGLVNLVHGWKPGDRNVSREFIRGDVTVEKISGELHALLTDESRRREISGAMRDVRRAVLGPDGAAPPALCAARELLKVLDQ